MNEAVSDTLRRLLVAHGPGLIGQVRRVEGLLRDLHPGDPREVSVLIESIEQGVVRCILDDGRPSAEERQALIAKLTEGSGMALSPAGWAVGVWIDALVGPAAAGGGSSGRWQSAIVERPGTLAGVLGLKER